MPRARPLPVARCPLLDARCPLLDARCSMQRARPLWTQDRAATSRSQDGWTAMHAAAELGRVEAVQLLLRYEPPEQQKLGQEQKQGSRLANAVVRAPADAEPHALPGGRGLCASERRAVLYWTAAAGVNSCSFPRWRRQTATRPCWWPPRTASWTSQSCCCTARPTPTLWTRCAAQPPAPAENPPGPYCGPA
jgi:hypothetical protein